jgi:hypothetical protein
MASMSSRADSLKRVSCVTFAALATACADAAPPAASVCPARPDAAVTQIDLFDGDPADQAQLAPDDDRAGTNTYSVKGVYDAGRTLTIRCHYGHATTDVKLAKPVAQCRYSGDAHPALACK